MGMRKFRGTFLLGLWAAVVLITLIALRNYDWYPAVGTSMSPTIQPGDILLVQNGHEDWKRGDLILFQVDGEETLFVKRIVGLPGDRVEAVRGRLRVNGQPWREGPLADIPLPDFPAQRVPPGRLFVMGDNPPKSEDSRSFGPISEEAVQGSVRAILYPLSRMKGL